MNIRAVGERKPSISPSAYVDPMAVIMGQVAVGEGVGIWPGAVIRGDDEAITLEAGSMVLEGCIIEAPQGKPVRIGPRAIISHGAIVHGAEVRAGALVGIGAIVLDGAEIGEEALVGAGAVVAPGTLVPACTLFLGIPAREVRELSEEDLAQMKREQEELAGKLELYRSITPVANCSWKGATEGGNN